MMAVRPLARPRAIAPVLAVGARSHAPRAATARGAWRARSSGPSGRGGGAEGEGGQGALQGVRAGGGRVWWAARPLGPCASACRGASTGGAALAHINVDVLTTPNEDAVKLLPGCDVTGEVRTVSVRHKDLTASSEDTALLQLARPLLAIPGLKGLLFGYDFITLEKESSFEWEGIEVRRRARSAHAHGRARRALIRHLRAQGIRVCIGIAIAMCMHKYIHAYIYIHTYTYMHIHTCIHAYMHTCIHAYMHTCIHAYMHTCM